MQLGGAHSKDLEARDLLRLALFLFAELEVVDLVDELDDLLPELAMVLLDLLPLEMNQEVLTVDEK